MAFHTMYEVILDYSHLRKTNDLQIKERKDYFKNQWQVERMVTESIFSFSEIP